MVAEVIELSWILLRIGLVLLAMLSPTQLRIWWR